MIHPHRVFLGISLYLLLAGDVTARAQTLPAELPALLGDQIVLKAEQSTGGTMMKQGDKLIGVMLDKSCQANFKKKEDACIEWKVATPLPAGWWRGTVKSGLRPGYANREIAVQMMGGGKPSVLIHPNFVNHKAGTPQIFEFWIYTSAPSEAVRIQPPSDLWIFNYTWPVTEIVLERKAPTELTDADAITLDLPVAADGAVKLPNPLPPGSWSFSGPFTAKAAATMTIDGQKTIEVPLTLDQYKRPGTSYAFTPAPTTKLTLSDAKASKSLTLKHNITSRSKPPAADQKLITTIDPAKPESAELVLIGSGLTGEAPKFTLLPRGQKTAVLTTWDDGAEPDLRCAEVLTKLGYRPSFFMNNNSAAMKYLDKLEALGVEVGSHCYNHPKLYELPPESVAAECIEMRKVLEQKLGHPVISMAYPYGYWPAYDLSGDYVLNAVKDAGYWSGRTTRTAPNTVESYEKADLGAMDSDGFFGNQKPLEAAWAKTKEKDGGVFYFWGHSWQIGKTDEQWAKFETFVTQFANQPNTWYPTQGEFSLWLWSRKNVKLEVASKSTDKVTVKLTRPWLHPYLAVKCPLTFTVPAGVTKVVWAGKEMPVFDGRVEINWVGAN